MVDREGRDKYAEIARHLLTGVMTVDDYEDRTEDYAYSSEDEGVWPIWHTIWCLYDDVRTERLRDRWALTPETRKDMARCLLFLYSDCEYSWPSVGISWSGCLLNVLSLGLWRRMTEPRRQREMRQIGDIEVWPFLNRAEYEAALQKPKFFIRQT
jgi:hypothetical protein